MKFRRAWLVHHVHQRDQLIRIGNVSGASIQQIWVAFGCAAPRSRISTYERRLVANSAIPELEGSVYTRVNTDRWRDADGLLDPPVLRKLNPNTAYIFQINLVYPANIHDCDDDYPLTPKLLEIKTEILSGMQLRLRRLYYGDSEPFSRKLLCSLLAKTHYVVFSKTLKSYLERGMKVTKVHRANRFEE